jgi:DNA repair protein RecO
MLVYLFSREFGRINGLAKGVRKGGRQGTPIERGFLVEHMTYFRQHGDLHQITDCQIVEFFPEVRGCLEKTAVRDVALDLLLSGVRDSDAHPDLFDFLKQFIFLLERAPAEESALMAQLSKALLIISGHLGFTLDFKRCALCGTSLSEKRLALSIETGTVYCERCGEHAPSGTVLYSEEAALFLSRDMLMLNGPVQSITKKELASLLRQSWEFCRYHLDIKKDSQALRFTEKLFELHPLP